MMFINNLLVLWGVNAYIFQTILGLVLLGAFEVDRARLSIIKHQMVPAKQDYTEGSGDE